MPKNGKTYAFFPGLCARFLAISFRFPPDAEGYFRSQKSAPAVAFHALTLRSKNFFSHLAKNFRENLREGERRSTSARIRRIYSPLPPTFYSVTIIFSHFVFINDLHMPRCPLWFQCSGEWSASRTHPLIYRDDEFSRDRPRKGSSGFLRRASRRSPAVSRDAPATP